MTMRPMTDAELAVVEGLRAGDLNALAELLKMELSDVHPLVQRNLRKLIVGRTDETDFRLVAAQHPELKDKRKSIHAEQEADQKAIEIALTYAKHGGFIHGKGKAALAETERAHGIKRTAVMEAWSIYRVWVAQAAQHGQATLPVEFRPSDAQLKKIIRTGRRSARTVDLSEPK